MRKTFALVAATVGFAVVCSAGQITLSFQLSELGLPNGLCGAACPSVNGLTVQGVTFGFSGSANAVYGFTLGVPTQNLSDPVLDGPSDGTLTLTFASPTPLLQFDVALAVANSESPGFNVLLSGPGFGAPTNFPVNTTTPIVLSEGQFMSSGPLISTAVITFSQNDMNPAFALDNLTFDVPDASTAIPEPQSLALLCSGLLLFCVLACFRRFHPSALHRL